MRTRALVISAGTAILAATIAFGAGGSVEAQPRGAAGGSTLGSTLGSTGGAAGGPGTPTGSPGPSGNSAVQVIPARRGDQRPGRGDTRERTDGSDDAVRNPDGTRTVRVALAPTSFASDNGQRRRAGVTLTATPDGGAAADIGEPVKLGADTDAAELVSVGRAGRRLRFGRPNSSGVDRDAEPNVAASPAGRAATQGVRLGEGKAVGARSSKARRTSGTPSVSFADAFGSGTELRYDVLPDAVKESITLAAAPSGPDAPVFRFPIATEGLTTRTTKDGSFQFIDAKGAVAFTVQPAFMFDARGGRGTPGNAYTAVRTELVTDATGTTIVLSPSLAWLRSPQRVYPVVIDPTVQLQPWNPMNLGYMPWGDNSGGSTFSAWTNEMMFGNWWGSKWRSFLQFDPSLFAGRTINKATLNLRVQSCDDQFNHDRPYANAILVHQLTSPYWFGQEWSGPSWDTVLSAQPAGPDSLAAVDITALAARWAAGTAPNYGLGLDMGSADAYCRVQRTSADTQGTFVEVTYNEAAAPSSADIGMLRNFSFESGKSSWQLCYQAAGSSFATDEGLTPFGSRYARIDQGVTRSLCQTVPAALGPGRQYTMYAYVFAPPIGSPRPQVRGELHLTEVGPSPSTAVGVFETTELGWMYAQVQLDSKSAANYALKAEVFGYDLDVDFVVLRETTAPPAPPTSVPPTTGPPPTTAPPRVPTTDRLDIGQSLLLGQYLESANGRYRAALNRADFTVWDMSTPAPRVVWTIGFEDTASPVLVLPWTSNLELWSLAPPSHQLWQTQTWALASASHLDLRDDGLLVLTSGLGTPLWSSAPLGPTTPTRA